MCACICRDALIGVLRDPDALLRLHHGTSQRQDGGAEESGGHDAIMRQQEDDAPASPSSLTLSQRQSLRESEHGQGPALSQHGGSDVSFDSHTHASDANPRSSPAKTPQRPPLVRQVTACCDFLSVQCQLTPACYPGAATLASEGCIALAHCRVDKTRAPKL